VILFGGPPCQGFSTSNQRTRNKENQNNWLFLEFFRISDIVKPDWIVIENVAGITHTANGDFLSLITSQLDAEGIILPLACFKLLNMVFHKNAKV